VDVDVRVIAATNKDLAEEVKAGRFREDLFYRLQVVPVTLPPLREREGDVELLAQHFLKRHAADLDRSGLAFSGAALKILSSYAWPGNIRELENLVERVAILSDSNEIQAEQIPQFMHNTPRVVVPQTNDFVLPTHGVDFNALVDDYGNKLITTALSQTGGNKKAAAKLLGLNRTTLVEKIKKKGLESRIEVTSVNEDIAV
jgi:DNA-binding NtrC family response regulator